jgi:hypothetical protein
MNVTGFLAVLTRALGILLLIVLIVGSVLHGGVQEILSTVSYLLVCALAISAALEQIAGRRVR